MFAFHRIVPAKVAHPVFHFFVGNALARYTSVHGRLAFFNEMTNALVNSADAWAFGFADAFVRIAPARIIFCADAVVLRAFAVFFVEEAHTRVLL
jgi:hypothetical protein